MSQAGCLGIIRRDVRAIYLKIFFPKIFLPREQKSSSGASTPNIKIPSTETNLNIRGTFQAYDYVVGIRNY